MQQKGRSAGETNFRGAPRKCPGLTYEPQVRFERPEEPCSETCLVICWRVQPMNREGAQAVRLPLHRGYCGREPYQNDVVAESGSLPRRLKGVLADSAKIRRQPVAEKDDARQHLSR